MDTPDAGTGLTPREKTAIRDSWSLVSVHLEDNGVSFLIKFFQDYPDDQNFFDSFRGSDPDTLRDDPSMCTHATKVMQALTAVVENLDNPGSLVDLLKNNAQTHHQRGIRLLQYKNLFNTFVDFLSSTLGSRCSNLTKEAWQKALGVVTSVIESELSKLSTSQNIVAHPIGDNSS